MFRSASVAIMSTADTATTYLGGSGHDIPTIAFGDNGNAFDVSLNSLSMTVPEQAEWLRTFASQVLELADEIDPPGTALAEQPIADAKAAAGIGGA